MGGGFWLDGFELHVGLGMEVLQANAKCCSSPAFLRAVGKRVVIESGAVSGAFLGSLGGHDESSEATDREGVQRWFSMESLPDNF